MEVNEIPEPLYRASSVFSQKPEKRQSMRQDRKMEEGGKKTAERKRGYNFPCVINFRSQVPHSFSLKPVFPLAAGQRLLTLFTFFRMSLGRRSVVTFQAMNTCLWRKIAYKMPSRALKRKITQSSTAIFHAIINVSGAIVLPQCWPPTLGMYDSLGEEKGALCSYLADSKLHYNRATGWSRGILSVGSASPPSASNTTTCTVQGRDH